MLVSTIVKFDILRHSPNDNRSLCIAWGCYSYGKKETKVNSPINVENTHLGLDNCHGTFWHLKTEQLQLLQRDELSREFHSRDEGFVMVRKMDPCAEYEIDFNASQCNKILISHDMSLCISTAAPYNTVAGKSKKGVTRNHELLIQQSKGQKLRTWKKITKTLKKAHTLQQNKTCISNQSYASLGQINIQNQCEESTKANVYPF